MAIYIPRHFRIEELIPPVALLPEPLQRVYHSDKEKLWRLFYAPLLVTLDRFRDRFGVMTVNDWSFHDAELWEHCRRWSGYRPEACEIGADLSEHRQGRAFDAIFRTVHPSMVRRDIQENAWHPAYEFIQRIEAFHGMDWFHADFGNHPRWGEAIQVIGKGRSRGGLPAYIARGE